MYGRIGSDMATVSLLIALTVFATGGVTAEMTHADQLFEAGDYRAARLAYKRLLFYQPDTDFRDVADYRIAQSYYYQDRPVRAMTLFREFLDVHPNSPFRLESQFMIGQLHFDAGEYSLARTALFELLHTGAGTEVAAAAHYLRGWCYVRTGDWNKAIAELRRVDTRQAGASQAKNAPLLADQLLERTPLPHKSPKVAGWLSTLVPGSGQLYAGRVKEGILAAALSGTFIYLAVDAIRERRYVDCAGVSLVGWHFYWGNRTDAQRFAAEYNTFHERELIETLRMGGVSPSR